MTFTWKCCLELVVALHFMMSWKFLQMNGFYDTRNLNGACVHTFRADWPKCRVFVHACVYVLFALSLIAENSEWAREREREGDTMHCNNSILTRLKLIFMVLLSTVSLWRYGQMCLWECRFMLVFALAHRHNRLWLSAFCCLNFMHNIRFCMFSPNTTVRISTKSLLRRLVFASRKLTSILCMHDRLVEHFQQNKNARCP